MKQLTKNLLIAFVATFFLFSCGGDPIASNPDIAKMSDAGKKAMDEASLSLCACLKDEGAGLKKVTQNVKDVSAEVKKAADDDAKKAAMDKLKDVVGEMKGFLECMNKAKPSEEASKAMKEDVTKLVGEEADRETKTKKNFEIIQSYLDKNCSSNSAIFRDYVATMEIMNEMRKNK